MPIGNLTGRTTMVQSKLEVHLQILKAIALHDAVDDSKVAFYSKITFDVANQSLRFLSSQGLIEHDQKGSYRIARRGMAVLKYFGLLEEHFQVIENY